jgi:hypothetical protein
MTRFSDGSAVSSSTSIFALPEDVLCRIFALCLPDREFAHVCRDWRAFALDCPLLWTEIDFCQDVPDGALENLRRAGSAPLAVNFCAQDVWKFRSRFSLQDCADAYLTKLATVRTLRFNCYHAIYAGPILAAHGAAPLLEDLDLSFGHYESSTGSFNGWDEALEADDPGYLELGADFLRGDAPRLRQLTLANTWIAPAWPPFAHLRELRIHSVSQSQNQTAYDVLQLLRATPCLETLVLWDAMSILGNESADDRLAAFTAVPLRHLRYLEIVERPADLADFVSCISDVSSTVKIRLTGTTVFGGDQVAQTITTAFFDGIAAHVAAWRRNFFESTVAISADDYVGASIKVWAVSDTLPWLIVTLEDTPPPRFFKSLERVMPLGDLSHLMVLLHSPGTSTGTPISAEEWMTVLARMTRIAIMTVYFTQRAHEICNALLLPVGSAGKPVCPSLRRLVLDRVKLRQPESSSLLTLLPDVVLARHDAGVPLKTLELRHIQYEGVAAVRAALAARSADVVVCADEGWRGWYFGMELWPDGEQQKWMESEDEPYCPDTYHNGFGPTDGELIDGCLTRQSR